MSFDSRVDVDRGSNATAQPEEGVVTGGIYRVWQVLFFWCTCRVLSSH
jgi:hypothetical protein